MALGISGNSIMVEFGNGTTVISSTAQHPIITLRTCNQAELGTEVSNKDVLTNEPEVKMVFNKTESIDLMIEALERAKRSFYKLMAV